MNMTQWVPFFSFLPAILSICAAALIWLDGRKRKTEQGRQDTGALLLVSLFLTVTGILLSLYLRTPIADAAVLVFPPLLMLLFRRA